LARAGVQGRDAAARPGNAGAAARGQGAKALTVFLKQRSLPYPSPSEVGFIRLRQLNAQLG
jgi:hypothetical protein